MSIVRVGARSTCSIAFVALLSLADPASAAMLNCTAATIIALGVPRMTVTAATVVPAAAPNPEYCDVRGSVDTGGNSAGFRFQLPVNWNGKLLFYGVGGTGGNVLAPSPNGVDRAASLVKGYATGVTDTGHQNPNNADASFALTAPGVRNTAALVDYYYRAAHEVTVALKALLPRFYGAASVGRSYFDGCSNGGRMGLEAAKHYPDDYDGIIIGAPVPSQRQILLLLKGAETNLEPPSARMPAEMLPVIDAAVYASCDAADGVSDGLIQNPALCSFDPQTLVCPAGNAANCLTQDQANGLKNYLRPLTDGKDRVLTPAHSVTDLAGGPINYQAYSLGPNPPIDPTGAEPWGTGPMARGWSLGDTTLKYIVYLDPTFNTRTFPMTVDGRIDDAAIDRFDAATADGTVSPSDLAKFIRKKRKMIIYHGFADHALSPFTTMQFYERLAKGHYAKLQATVRLFMVPGMQHCGGGRGPNTFDTLTALENWVEHGVAPDSILATHSTGTTVDRSMPLCKFPEKARYRGAGNVNDAANWSCSPEPALLESGPAGTQAGLTHERRDAQHNASRHDEGAREDDD